MWDDWDQETYAAIMLAFLQPKMPWLTMDDVFVPPDKVVSWTFREDGSVSLRSVQPREGSEDLRFGQLKPSLTGVFELGGAEHAF